MIDTNGAWATINSFTILTKDSLGLATATSSVFDSEGWAIYEDATGASIGTLGTVTGGATKIGKGNSDCAPQKHFQWIAQRTAPLATTFNISNSKQQ